MRGNGPTRRPCYPIGRRDEGLDGLDELDELDAAGPPPASPFDGLEPRTAVRAGVVDARDREVALRTEPAVAGLIAHVRPSAQALHKSDGDSRPRRTSRTLRTETPFEPVRADPV